MHCSALTNEDLSAINNHKMKECKPFSVIAAFRKQVEDMAGCRLVNRRLKQHPAENQRSGEGACSLYGFQRPS